MLHGSAFLETDLLEDTKILGTTIMIKRKIFPDREMVRHSGKET
jgi:hypothetical protein